MAEEVGSGGKLGFQFIPIPVAIYQRKDLTLTDKMLVGRILSFGAKSCFLSQKTCADELGVHRQHINERLKSLAEKGIIEAKRGRYGKSYRVASDVRYSGHLQGEVTNSDVRYSGRQMSGRADVRCPVERTQVDVLEDSLGEQSSSALTLSDSNDDERPSPGNPNTEDLEALISVARDQLQAARAADRNVPLDEIPRPDRTITIKILEVFAGYADFQTWLQGTVRRHVAQKSRSETWGLYLADAQNQAEGIARQRVAEEKAAAEAATAQEQRLAEESERKRAAVSPVPPEQAVAAADAVIGQASFRIRGVPEVIKRRLMRLGQPISMAEVIKMTREYRKCTACGDTGLVGSALDKSRRFCECMAGENLAAEDPERPAREIESAHACLKNRMVAAAHSKHWSFLADAIEASTITEESSELILDAPKLWRLCFSGPDFIEVVQLAGETRSVRLAWKTAA
jgi:hypothetical protein